MLTQTSEKRLKNRFSQEKRGPVSGKASHKKTHSNKLPHECVVGGGGNWIAGILSWARKT